MLYSRLILQHAKQPQNKGRITKPTEVFDGANPFCGDKITIYVKIDKQKKIKEVMWEGNGCAISQASTSMFSDIIKGKTLEQVKKISSQNLLKKLEINLSPTRVKCALLPLYTIKEEL